MAPHRPVQRLLFGVVAALTLTGVMVGCVGGGQLKPSVVSTLSFEQHATTLLNDTIPLANPGVACGTLQAEFGAELASLADPRQAKVLREWGETIPGKQMFVAGGIQDFMFSGGDLPFTHPFANDVTFDIKPDPAYAALAQKHGQGNEPDGPPTGTLHWEISRNLIPHQDASTFLGGFLPQDGDRIASYGHWIVDCGHDDYHTELHPPTFVSFAHTEGTSTLAHAFYNPYYESQLYVTDASQAGALGNEARFQDPYTLPFPYYLAAQLGRVLGVVPAGPLGAPQQLEAHHLIEANRSSPITWYVCAPQPKPSGASLSVSYQFTTRPGVSLAVKQDKSVGCAVFTAVIGQSYVPQDPVRKDCTVPWSILNKQAQDALGDPTIDIEKLIEAKVPPQAAPIIERDPLIDCYDPLVVRPPGPSSGNGVVTDANQPYPFYGQAKVSWSS